MFFCSIGKPTQRVTTLMKTIQPNFGVTWVKNRLNVKIVAQISHYNENSFEINVFSQYNAAGLGFRNFLFSFSNISFWDINAILASQKSKNCRGTKLGSRYLCFEEKIKPRSSKFGSKHGKKGKEDNKMSWTSNP